MSKLVELISEYFLGTKSREYYRNKTIYFEKIKNGDGDERTKKESELLSKQIKYSKRAGKIVFLEKMFSNSIESAFAITSLVTKDTSYLYLGVFLGECFRFGSLSNEIKRKEYWSLIESLVNNTSIIDSKINEAIKLVSEQYKQ